MARACADSSFPAEGDGSFSCADGAFFDWAAASFAQGALDVFCIDMEATNVIEPAVVGFAYERIDAKYVFVFRFGQRPTGDRSGGVPNAQRARENDRRFNLAE